MVDVAKHLLKGLERCAGGALTIEAVASRPWASITFSGQVVSARMAASAAAERLCDLASEHEFAIPGHIVADVGVIDRSAATVSIEALIIEAA